MKPNTLLLNTILSVGITFSCISTSFAEAINNHDAVHSTNGQLVRSTNGNCVRTKWVSDGDECNSVPKAKPASMQIPQAHHLLIPDENRTIYFEFNQSSLTESERQKINSLTTELESMHDITGVRIVGYADRMGSDSYNKRISEKRAESVERYLRKQGYLKTSIAKTQWLGESVPVTHCPTNLNRSSLIECLQKDRRVTIEINYQESPSHVTPTN